jgi:hypothetical protein
MHVNSTPHAAVSSAIKSESRSIPALAPGSASVDRWIDDEWISSRGQTSSHNSTIIYHNGHPALSRNLRVDILSMRVPEVHRECLYAIIYYQGT